MGVYCSGDVGGCCDQGCSPNPHYLEPNPKTVDCDKGQTHYLKRGNKEILPYIPGFIVTTYLDDYIDPIAMAGYYDFPVRGTKSSYAHDVHKYFNNSRSCIYSCQNRNKFMAHPNHSPCDTCSIPYPDVALREKTRVLDSKKLYQRASLRPANVDVCRSANYDCFYNCAQKQRDFLVDKSEDRMPLAFFDVGRPWPTNCEADEREFKITGISRGERKPHSRTPLNYCHGLPCIINQSLFKPFEKAELPRDPFRCGKVKAKDLFEHQILLV